MHVLHATNKAEKRKGDDPAHARFVPITPVSMSPTAKTGRRSAAAAFFKDIFMTRAVIAGL